MNIRKNLFYILSYGNVLPFYWNTKGFRCFFCTKQATDGTSLKEHTFSKHCNVDLDTFITEKIVSKDFPVKIDVTNLACKVCDQSMTSLENLIDHVITEHEAMYDTNAGVCALPFLLNKDVMQCVICEARYDNFPSLVTHMYKEHMQHPFVCQICGLSFINEVRLKRHFQYAHIGHKCSICNKLFDAFHKMVRHKERIHGQVKSHECSLCSATFESVYQLKVHMGNVHNVEKYRIRCEHCPKICTTKGAMVLHIQSVHSDMKYSCDICDYKSGIKWMVTLHKRKHFGEKNYTCSLCERKFGRSSNLRAHMKVHTGRVGRVCRYCKKGFIDNESLKKHEMELHYYNQYV